MTTDTRENIKSQPRDAKGKLLPKVTDSPLAVIYQAVNQALVAIRTRHPEVPQVMLVVGATGRKPGGNLNLGYFTPQSWESKQAKHEIVISGESLKNGAEDVMGTLLHECAHALATAREIKDTSRQGRFHNKKFKDLAEELGIEVEHSKSIGWSITTVPAATKALYKTEIAELKKALKGYRVERLVPTKPKTTVKVECDCRSITLPISFIEKGDIRCEECGETFEEVSVRPKKPTKAPVIETVADEDAA